jgi:hypothetical protein
VTGVGWRRWTLKEEGEDDAMASGCVFAAMSRGRS